MTEVSPRRRREVIDALAPRHRARQRPRPAGRRPGPVRPRAATPSWTPSAGGGGGVQGGPRRVRLGQDVLHPASRRGRRCGARLGDRGGADQRDRDPAAPPGDRVSADHRVVADATVPPSAFRAILDGWLFTLEDDALAADPSLAGAVRARSDHRGGRPAGASGWRRVSSKTPAFAQALRGYRAAVLAGDAPDRGRRWRPGWAASRTWRRPRPNARPGVRGDLDHFGAMAFLQGLLTVLRTPATPGCWWCWTRSRPCNGCVATSATRR